MSLELKIEELTAAVKDLTTLLGGVKDGTYLRAQNVAAPAVTAEEVVKEMEASEAPVAPAEAPTHADLKAVCLRVAREGKKEEVKGVLKAHGAAKAVDVPVLVIGEVIAAIEAL